MAPYLPPEILAMIISYISDIETLLALRLVNRDWHDVVDSHAPQRLYVDILSKNLKRLHHVMQTASLRNQVRTLVWNFPNRPGGDTGAFSNNLVATGLRSLELSLASLNLTTRRLEQFVFPKLAHFAIHFRPPPVGGDHPCTTKDKAQLVGRMFELAFMGMHGLQDLDELSIHNIPIEMTFPRFPNQNVSGPAFGQRLENLGLKSLRLSFLAPEVWPYAKDRKGKPALNQPADLALSPVLHTLRHLSLSYCGCYMKNTPWHPRSGTELPHLQSLELRSCGFTNSQVLLWILRRGNTLRSLKFDDCAIIYSLELCPCSELETRSTELTREIDGGRVYQIYNGRWAEWFRVLGNGLPRLQRFEFGSSRVREPGERGPRFKSEASMGPKFGHTNQFLFGLFPDRYLEMKDGTLDIPWISRPLGRGRKFKDPPQSVEQSNKDESALRRLLQVIGQTVRENDRSSHAAGVYNLRGWVIDC